MPSFLQIENISKSYGPKILFENIAFNINEGDKIALIAPNGSGKTSLLRILAGKDKSDSGGSIRFLKEIRIAFLEQDYSFRPELSVWEQLESECPAGDGSAFSEERQEWELRARQIMTELKLRPDQIMHELSGGEVKRVAITQLFAQDADFLIMDEPTNHLDIDAIEYLENFLKRSRCTLLMVTHDRYFLDRVCNTVMELDRGALWTYKGDYQNYLEKRSERIAQYNAETDKVRNILRRELEWMHATPCARSGKAKYRKQAFWDLKDRAEDVRVEKQVSMAEFGTTSRLGTKIINCRDLCFGYEGKQIVSHFTYNFQRYERVGMVGANGVGKSTFLQLLTESSLVDRGESLKIGWYRQSGMAFRESDTVLDVVPDTRLLGKFLFPHDMLTTRIEKLSGGEKRRLYLLTILMQDPNLLILDEPTNDLDIVTLNILEEYLLDFKGTLIIVSHDRHFLDRLVDHLFVFCGNGVIKDFIGGYTEYRSFINDLKAQKRAEEREAEQKNIANKEPASKPNERKRLNFKERCELKQLEARMESLNLEKESIEVLLNGGSSDYLEIQKASNRYQALKDELDIVELRWLELSEIPQ